MLRVYNYMVLGLAITGLAALGIYMLSVTGDMAAAAKIAAQRRGNSGARSPATCISRRSATTSSSARSNG